MGAERDRLAASAAIDSPWRRWGPYLAERQWGTVREDYSAHGDAWRHFPHEHARSRAYRWGEDGLAGYSDDHQRVCLALALWNGADPILKERLFGLANEEGNHGEDVKEQYHYLDATPTHSWGVQLYRYPLAAFPYDDLVDTNLRRSRHAPEYELVDTGVFDDDRYVDVLVEWAKDAPDDLCWRITVTNRSAEEATIHVLPTVWFRNTWSWDGPAVGGRPMLRAVDPVDGHPVVRLDHAELGTRWWVVDADVPLLFCENETNTLRLFDKDPITAHPKDAVHDAVVAGRADATNPEQVGTKVAAHHVVVIPAGGTAVVRSRLLDRPPVAADVAGIDAVMTARRADADEMHDELAPPGLDDEGRMILRQALAGMLWTKQYYELDQTRWLAGDPPFGRRGPAYRNRSWRHMRAADILSMPDTWEYPWFAAWDTAFHCVPLASIDPQFAKNQLDLFLDARYLHPNGQLPAYEWNFSDVNPPVHAWATRFVHDLEARTTEADPDFLERAFVKLLVNFTWWVNRKDPDDNDVFGGGFLGLDNIGVFDRSRPLPGGATLDQADGTAWMALFSLNMLEIAVEVCRSSAGFAPLAVKFLDHFTDIAVAMLRGADDHVGLWDEDDGFFYDLLRMPDGSAHRLKVRSLVGLLPMCAVTVIEADQLDAPGLRERLVELRERYPERASALGGLDAVDGSSRVLLSALDEGRLRRVLARMLDPDEFLADHGIRSLSKAHRDEPYTFLLGGEAHTVQYEPADSTTGMFGGNSNWRGPIWFPTNAMIIRSLLAYHAAYGDELRVPCPYPDGPELTLYEVAEEISRRLVSIFRVGPDGRRPVFGGADRYADPAWRDHLLFYEFFNGDDGAGIGASHQTGWTGLVATLLQVFGCTTASDLAEHGLGAVRLATAPPTRPAP
ncbi:MAG TPA: hypothetical protein VK866_19635 [Acidimicrobiales bacterium]|nr:hypothetical protein [Acidimicrobiales bacterium]